MRSTSEMVVYFERFLVEVLDNEDIRITTETYLCDITGMDDDYLDVVSRSMEAEFLGFQFEPEDERLTVERFVTVGGYLEWLRSKIPKPDTVAIQMGEMAA